MNRPAPIIRLLPFVVVAAAFAFPDGVFADEERNPSPVDVRLLSGRSVSGEFVSLDAKRLTIKGKTAGAVPVADVLRIDFKTPSAELRLADAFVYLANGDRLAASATGMDGEHLHVRFDRLPGRPAANIPLLTVRGVVLKRPDRQADWSPLESLLLTFDGKNDLVVLRNGDRVAGRIAELNETHVTLAGETGKISRDGVRAFAFDPRFLERPEALGPRMLLQLADGSRITAGKAVARTAAGLRIETSFGAELDVPVSAVRSLLSLPGNVEPLSRLKPAAFEHTPYIDGKHELHRNRNVLSGPLMLRGREYPLGLGMHSRSRATWELDGKPRTFLATVGVDDAANGRGSVVFRVLLDGKEAFASPMVTGRSDPLPIGPIPLNGVKRLTLVADFGPHGDLLDYANWCDAVLVK